MKWNFPITKTIKCHKCSKEFEIVLVDRNSKEHPCPDCGFIHVIDFDVVEESLLKEAKEVDVTSLFRAI
jgi:DNA-directed RNA polymerase subunit RPC12/RpoP